METGIQLSSSCALSLCSLLLDAGQLQFLLASRLIQDCIENVFSVVRSRNRTPTPRQFRYALKLISVAQYLKGVKGSDYALDEREYLAEFLPTNMTPPSNDDAIDFPDFTDDPCISGDEQQSLYYIAGYCIQPLLKLKQLCASCAVQLKMPGVHHPHKTEELYRRCTA